jgi:hypothetical protein
MLLVAIEKQIRRDKSCEGNSNLNEMRGAHSRSPDQDSSYDTLTSGEIKKRWRKNGAKVANGEPQSCLRRNLAFACGLKGRWLRARLK